MCIRDRISAIRRGSSFGAPTEAEVLFARELVARVPSFEKVRLCSSGTEATMHAIRLARGYTGRDLVLKFDGCYHGAHDALLVSAGSGVVTFAKPGSPGIPEAVASNTLVAPFNDLAAVEEICATHGERLAAIILEPVTGNMGCIAPGAGYLEGLRRLCDKTGAVLIFDEVMTGFRVHESSAQGLYGVTPDLSCFGKVVGGGFPLAAFGGKREIMACLSPEGPVYQAGTLSGNPVAVAAGLAALEGLTRDRYARIEALGAALDQRLAPAVEAAGASYSRVGGMFTIFFRSECPRSFAEVKQCDLEAFGRFFRESLDRGIYLPPSQFEAAFLSAMMTDEQLDTVIAGLIESMHAALASA